MHKAHDQLGRLRIAVPCQADWEGMAGDERVRHCTLCSLGVEHRPVAGEEAHVILFEPAGTLNTGNVRNELTIDAPERML